MVQMAIPIIRISPVTENRDPFPLPDFYSKIFHDNGRLAAELNRWFDDRVGFRAFFIRLNNQIQYSLFNHSDKVYIGRDKTLFLRGFIEAKLAFERGGEPWQEAMRAQFLALSRYLDRRNIRLVVVSNPIKASVYPELLPREVPRLPTVTQFDKLRQFLKETPRWIYVDGKDSMASCGSYPLFYRTDIHSTYPATFCIAKEIVAKIAVAEGRKESFWEPRWSYRKQNFSGGLANFLAVLFKPVETIDIPDSYYDPTQPAPDGVIDQASGSLFETIYRANESAREPKLPPIVIYGDSFAHPYLASGMYFQFSKVYRVRSNGIPIETLLSDMPPSTRYLVVQFLEGSMSGFLAYKIPMAE